MRHLTFDCKGAEQEPTCYIFGAGVFYGLWSRPKDGDLVIAADGGLRYVEALGLRPDVVLGDFDSESEAFARRAAQGDGATASNGAGVSDGVVTSDGAGASNDAAVSGSTAAFVALSVTKDRSDSAAAIQYGRQQGFRRFYLYGCTGMRLDHTLASIQDMAALAAEGCSAYLFDDGAVLTVIHEAALDFPAGSAGGISVFAYGGRAEQVWESGLLYTVAEHVLTDTFPLGLSNAFTALPASVAVGKGALLIYVRPEEAAGVPAAVPSSEGALPEKVRTNEAALNPSEGQVREVGHAG